MKRYYLTTLINRITTIKEFAKQEKIGYSTMKKYIANYENGLFEKVPAKYIIMFNDVALD